MIGNEQQLFKTCKYLSLKLRISNGRVKVVGNVPQEIEEALRNNPELEARMVLREASKNAELLESIQERASIRWAEGLSDSLYNAVLCNIKPMEEKPERDDEGKIILRPCADWEAELKKYS